MGLRVLLQIEAEDTLVEIKICEGENMTLLDS